MSFHLHRRYLRRYVESGDHILEAGAGAGRFTIELARLGANITVGDVSPVQLRLNREKVAEVGCEQRIVDRVRLDITDLSRFPDRSFDGVVCYGGPLVTSSTVPTTPWRRCFASPGPADLSY